MSESRTSVLHSASDDDQVVMSSTGVPFEIIGFRPDTDRFDNHEENVARVDSLSDSPAIEMAFRIVSGRNSS